MSEYKDRSFTPRRAGAFHNSIRFRSGTTAIPTEALKSRKQVTKKPKQPPKLTRRRREILDFIKSHHDEFGFAPSIREIGNHVGLNSSSTVHSHLFALEKMGYIKRNPSKPRAIQVIDRDQLEQTAALLRSVLDRWTDLNTEQQRAAHVAALDLGWELCEPEPDDPQFVPEPEYWVDQVCNELQDAGGEWTEQDYYNWNAWANEPGDPRFEAFNQGWLHARWAHDAMKQQHQDAKAVV